MRQFQLSLLIYQIKRLKIRDISFEPVADLGYDQVVAARLVVHRPVHAAAEEVLVVLGVDLGQD